MSNPAPQTRGPAQHRTVRAAECPIRVLVEGRTLGHRTHSVAARGPNPSGKPVVIERLEDGHVRFGVTPDGERICLGGRSTQLWVEP
jgi:hypothetical protein